MGIGKLPDDDDEDVGLFAEINITPLTDVFLVMVIIFMISALAVQAEAREERLKAKADTSEESEKAGLKVNLPSGAAQEIDPQRASLIIIIPVSGDVEIAGKTISDADLDNLFRAAYARDQSTQVILQADRSVAHGRVVNLMERAKAAGLSKLAFKTK